MKNALCNTSSFFLFSILLLFISVSNFYENVEVLDNYLWDLPVIYASAADRMTAKTTKNIATHLHEHLRVNPFSKRGGLKPRRTPTGLPDSVPALL